MRAVRLHEIDRERGPQLFRVEQIDDPKPGPGEPLVAIKRAAFNRRDVFISQGCIRGSSSRARRVRTASVPSGRMATARTVRRSGRAS